MFYVITILLIPLQKVQQTALFTLFTHSKQFYPPKSAINSALNCQKQFIQHSFLSDRFKRNYEQAYMTRLNKLSGP